MYGLLVQNVAMKIKLDIPENILQDLDSKITGIYCVSDYFNHQKCQRCAINGRTDISFVSTE